MSRSETGRFTLIARLSIAVYLSVIAAEADAERVGYSFQGTFIQSTYSGTGTPPVDYNAFGFHFPFDAPFSGTFSYDTGAIGFVRYPSTPNIKDFKQSIQGGFTFNILNADGITPIVRLRADNYYIRVSNDYTPSGAPVASDLVSVEFNPLEDPTLPSILRNDVAYTKKPVAITAPLSWDSTMFSDPDEPKLHADLPTSGSFPFTGVMLGGTTSAAAFTITSFSRLTPAAGDYNVDGKVSQFDFNSWRSAFGQTSSEYAYADGNHDGIVDNCDYIVWRRASSAAGTGTDFATVPEPSTALFVALILSFLGMVDWRRSSW